MTMTNELHHSIRIGFELGFGSAPERESGGGGAALRVRNTQYVVRVHMLLTARGLIGFLRAVWCYAMPPTLLYSTLL